MLIIDDRSNKDLTHIQAVGSFAEGFSLDDYVTIKQDDGRMWVGQIVQPNRNYGLADGTHDTLSTHAIALLQIAGQEIPVESLQIYDILILAEYDGRRMLTSRIRPLPGSIVRRMSDDEISRITAIPELEQHASGTSNVIGELLNAENLPLCVTRDVFRYHVLVAGGGGSGKSNVSANLAFQAAEYRKCVIIHDVKPDYRLANRANIDPNVTATWERFKQHRLEPRGCSDVLRIGIQGLCDANKVDKIIGFHASDFTPQTLAGLFFPETEENREHDIFANIAFGLREQIENGDIGSFSVEQILQIVELRMDSKRTVAQDQIPEALGKSMMRKIRARRSNLPWLDSIQMHTTPPETASTPSTSNAGDDELQRPRRRNMPWLSGGPPSSGNTNTSGGGTSALSTEPRGTASLEAFDLAAWLKPGRLLIIDYSHFNDDQIHALILGHILGHSHRLLQDKKTRAGIVQLINEAQNIFDGQSALNNDLTKQLGHIVREGHSMGHAIVLNCQTTSQIPAWLVNNLNTKFIMRQNSRVEADAATQGIGKDYAHQVMQLGTGHALVSLHESRAVLLVNMAPAPFELSRRDNIAEASG
jgi:uncharacterized protein